MAKLLINLQRGTANDARFRRWNACALARSPLKIAANLARHFAPHHRTACAPPCTLESNNKRPLKTTPIWLFQRKGQDTIFTVREGQGRDKRQSTSGVYIVQCLILAYGLRPCHGSPRFQPARTFRHRENASNFFVDRDDKGSFRQSIAVGVGLLCFPDPRQHIQTQPKTSASVVLARPRAAFG